MQLEENARLQLAIKVIHTPTPTYSSRPKKADSDDTDATMNR